MTPPRLVQLPGVVTVTVTREEDHQDVLSRYRFPDVVAELAWCTATKGKHAGQRAIEVRVDGRRVGELTHAMTRRYARMVDTVLAQHNRPGCEARIDHGARGYQLELRLPKVSDAAPAPVLPLPTQYVPVPPAPAAPVAAGVSRKAKIWISVAAAVGIFAIIGALNEPDKAPPSQQAASLGVAPTTTTTTTTTAAPVIHAPATTTTTTTTTTTKKAVTTTKPAPHTTTKKRTPVTTKHKTVKPKPANNCNPNYSPCVPNASDVDCAGGSGNGPVYVEGPITIIGSDPYGLDGNDHDGIGCEN